ncbi:MAG TPA: hypothetical protein VG371_02215 [Solirubrobacteraceae bacterium]|nr:hypothetical protein [Solirubrobacteraceae bacterium]
MQETDHVHAPNHGQEANRDRLRRSFAVALTLIGCALALTACGSSSPRSARSPSGSGSNPNQAQILTDSLRFTRCERANGVPNFPDPPGNGGYGVKSFAQESNGETMSINGVSVNAPAFRSAMAKCQHYLPQPPAPTTSQLAKIRPLMVTWAKCMRSHGLPDFGDPTITADGHRIMHGQFNIDSPAYQSARQACDPQLQRSMAAAGV